MDAIDKKILPDDIKKEYLDFIDKQVVEHPVVKVHHAKWKELIEWENGNQFSEWDGAKNTLVPVRLIKRKRRVVINLMKPLAEAIEGKINFMAMLSGFPNSSELLDQEAAKVATKLIAHNDYINNIEYLFEELKYDLIRTGNGWMKWTWDSGGHGFIKNGEKGDTKQEGEVMGCVPSIFNIRPDPTAKQREDMRWLVEVAEVTQDSILENFDVDKQDLKDAIDDSGEGMGKYVGMYEKEEEKDKDEETHIVKYFWEKAGKKFPKGRHIISLGNLVLWAKENPALGEIPYFHYGYKRYGNSIWHTGPFHHVQDIQREFNRMISIISEHLEGWRAKMVVPQGSILKEGAFTTDSFELLEIDSTRGEPHAMNMPELSPQVMAHRDFLMGSIDKVSNVHEVSYSQLPQYATRAPASLYSMMLEQENLKIDPMLKRINKTIVEMGKFRLRLMGEYYKQPRLVKVIGKEGSASIEYFKGADLHDNYDVKLTIGVNLNQSKVVQQNLLLQLKQQGAPIDWNKIFKLLNQGDIEQDLRGDIADETRADRENQAFINDTNDKKREEGGVFVYLHDDHELHLGKHTNLAKSEEAQRWDEKKWQALNMHILEHFQLIQMLNQMRQGMQGGGQPPGGPQSAPMPGQPPLPGAEMGGGGQPGPVPGGGEAETAVQEQAVSI